MAGDELYNHLLKHGRMDEAKVQKIFTQLVGAVSYVHSKSCVHRDLKLENILLDKHGNVKLVDFGFTREYQGTTSYLQTWCGTICYSAPEMLKGEKYAGEKVDVWSLGIILYALLCGELPFDEDDEAVTKTRILKEDPKYPDHIPEAAKELISKLLSKRQLLRPSLADVLRHPWLAEHAPQQQEILKLQQPPPFTTQLEKDTLQRMRSAGVDIDMVIENVLSQRCDGLAGWWALLIEKEERKERRRERKRREREAEVKSLRRISAASSRLLAPSLMEINEEEQGTRLLGNPPRPRGRVRNRSEGDSAAVAPDLPRVEEVKSGTPDPGPHTALWEDTPRSTSSTRRKPQPPPKEYPRRPRNASRGSNSVLRMSQYNPDLLAPPGVPQKRKRLPLKDQLATIKHWFKESAKRAKSPNSSKKSTSQSPKLPPGQRPPVDMEDLRRTSTGQLLELRKQSNSYNRPDLQSRATMPTRPRISTTSSNGSANSRSHSKRPSVSPSPLTPRSSYRRSSAGLRGRKSTSSSVSSIRSIHAHHHSHSKASSTSSTSMASPGGLSSSPHVARSPHASVKVLPATPVTGTFPSSIRVQLGPGGPRRPSPGVLGPLPTFRDATTARGGALSAFGPSSPGLHPVFARRKRSVFKGPTNLGGGASPRTRSTGSAEGSRSASLQGRRSGEVIQEEDEDEDEVEEVEVFSPVNEGVGEFVEELVEEEDENEISGVGLGVTEKARYFAESPGVSPRSVKEEAGYFAPAKGGGAEHA